MPSVVTAPRWELTLKTGWVSEFEEHCWTAYVTDGIGALQISVAVKDDDLVNDEDLRELAEDGPPASKVLVDVGLGEFAGVSFEYTSESAYWRKWYVAHGHVMLFITYNCGEGEENLERVDVDNILGTLKAR